MKITDFIGGESDIGYQSPITLIAGEIETKMENDTMRVIQQYGIDVDKEELLKALKYDRDQYDKGYLNGHIDGVLQGEKLYARPLGKWIRKVDEAGFISHICSKCGAEIEVEDCSDDMFCFNCGAYMKGGAE